MFYVSVHCTDMIQLRDIIITRDKSKTQQQ